MGTGTRHRWMGMKSEADHMHQMVARRILQTSLQHHLKTTMGTIHTLMALPLPQRSHIQHMLIAVALALCTNNPA